MMNKIQENKKSIKKTIEELVTELKEKMSDSEEKFFFEIWVNRDFWRNPKITLTIDESIHDKLDYLDKLVLIDYTIYGKDDWKDDTVDYIVDKCWKRLEEHLLCWSEADDVLVGGFTSDEEYSYLARSPYSGRLMGPEEALDKLEQRSVIERDTQLNIERFYHTSEFGDGNIVVSGKIRSVSQWTDSPSIELTFTRLSIHITQNGEIVPDWCNDEECDESIGIYIDGTSIGDGINKFVSRMVKEIDPEVMFRIREIIIDSLEYESRMNRLERFKNMTLSL